jgi:D-alanyl-D-alanine carboxypeptidase (penicillin-binding protein 5/6)
MTLISVVLGTDSESSRDENTLALLHYGFANFHRLEPVKAGRVMARLPVRDQPGRRARAVAATSFVDVFPRSARVRVRVQARRPIAGPLRKGARVGRVLVLADGRRVAAIPLLLARAVPAVSPATIARSFLTRPSTLVSVAVLLVGGLAGLAFWRQRVRRRPTGGAGAR